MIQNSTMNIMNEYNEIMKFLEYIKIYFLVIESMDASAGSLLEYILA